MHVIIHASYLLLVFAFSLVGSLSTNKAMIPSNRRHWLKHSVAGAITSIITINLEEVSCNAAETVGKDPNCNDARCLGVWDGLLADCPHNKNGFIGRAGCVSSQDDTPGIFAEPWDYSEKLSLDYNEQMRFLISVIELVSSKRGDTIQIERKIDRYLRVSFIDGKSGELSIGEFYFTPNDTTIQFRVGSSSSNNISSTNYIMISLSNLERCEMMRKEARFLKLPVLRNRKRLLFFGESDYDTFGPGSAALGPPAEMTTGELEGRQDVDPNLKIDLLEGFPFTRPKN